MKIFNILDYIVGILEYYVVWNSELDCDLIIDFVIYFLFIFIFEYYFSINGDIMNDLNDLVVIEMIWKNWVILLVMIINLIFEGFSFDFVY